MGVSAVLALCMRAVSRAFARLVIPCQTDLADSLNPYDLPLVLHVGALELPTGCSPVVVLLVMVQVPSASEALDATARSAVWGHGTIRVGQGAMIC